MKKVGIMTLFHHTYNYGAMLQAYALQKFICGLGYECEIISFDWMNEQTKMHYLNTSRSNKYKFIEFISSIPHSKQIYNAANIFKANGEYDIFVCGSDQIWGCKNSMPIQNLSHFALEFAKDTKTKIAYAASMGGNFVTERYKTAIKSPIKRLNAVSVREQSAIPFVQSMTNNDVVDVLDPTFLLSDTEWEKNLKIEKNKEEYILVYGFNGNEKLVEATRILKDKLKYPIKSISYDPNDTTGPIDFLSLILSAKYVITDSYHGTIFSVIFNKPFLSFEVDKIKSGYSGSTRIVDLLTKLELMNRYVSYEDDVENIIQLDQFINYEKVNRIIAKEKEESTNFLSNALKIEPDAEYDIVDSSDCYSCGACANVCQKNCISLLEDSLGFLKPNINKETCNNCGLCRKVCPSLKKMEINKSNTKVLAVAHKDKKQRLASSSAGAFYALADKIISKGGVVFGAAYDNDWSVNHISVNSIERLEKLRNSKYVQSNIRHTYRETEILLKQGVRVLYSGTPCQVAGLKSFLRKEYDKLYTADLICHGVPSPKLWEKYIDFHEEKNGEISYINMRGKQLGYVDGNNHPTIAYHIIHKNSKEVIEHFLDDIYFPICFSFCMDRCYDCQFKGENYHSDITMGDLWGVMKWRNELNDGRGNSVVVARTEKGIKLLEESELNLISANDYDLGENNYTFISSSYHESSDGYLRAIFEDSSIEKLFYENKSILENINQNNLIRYINGQVEQRTLLAKIVKVQSMSLPLEIDDSLKGKVVIYGAAKIGKLALDCLNLEVLCFVDEFSSETEYNGYPIYKLCDQRLRELISKNSSVAFLITPIWDMENIAGNINHQYKDMASVVSIGDMLKKINI